MQITKRQPIDASSSLRFQSLSNQYLLPLPDQEISEVIRSAEAIIDRLPWPAKLVAQIQMVTGARAIEILSLCWKDVYREGWIYVDAKKGSAGRAVYIGELLAHHPAKNRHPELPIFGALRYQQYYRLVKSTAGPSLRRSRVRFRVTNLFRCAAAQIARTVASGDIQSAQHLLGHRSPRSTHFYLKERG